MAFGFYSPISINAAQVPTTQTDFPVLVSVANSRFIIASNGGHVQNPNGYDIRPYSDSGITSAITGYELERYNPSTGEVIMWVKVGSLSSSTTPIYLAYGDASLNTDASSTTTWSNSFLDLYHLANGTLLNTNSSAPSGTNAVNNNGASAISGQIDGGGGFVGTINQYLSTANVTSPTAITLSGWCNANSFSFDYNPLISRLGAARQELFVKSNGKLACFMTGTGLVSFDGTGSHTLSTGTLYYLAVTYDSSSGLIAYVNAASDGTAAANGALNTTAVQTHISHQAGNNRYWDGMLDELRLSTIARSSDWITTEYNNQLAPGTFETLGAEVSLSPFSGLYTK